MPRVRVIRSRWWAVALRLVGGVLFPSFFLFAVANGVDLRDNPNALGVAALLLPLVYMFAVLLVVSANALRYRVEVDSTGIRVAGLFSSRSFRWNEIVEIGEISNFKLPGYHVGIRVDGSHNPRFNRWLFWNSTYRILLGMELGGLALSKYLNTRLRQWRRRQANWIGQAASAN